MKLSIPSIQPKDFKLLPYFPSSQVMHAVLAKGQKEQHFIVKILSTSSAAGPIQTCLQKLFKGTCPGILKPEAYWFDSAKNQILLFSKHHGLSLEQVLAIRRSEGTMFSSEQLGVLLRKLLNYLAIMEREQIFHLNIKPSNIFFDGQNWLLSEAMLPSSKLQPVYCVPEMPMPSTPEQSTLISLQMTKMKDKPQADLYSVGAVMLEVCSLRTAEEIGCFREMGNKDKAEQANKIVEQIKKEYGEPWINILNAMMQMQQPSRAKASSLISSKFYRDLNIKSSASEVRRDFSRYIEPSDESRCTPFDYGRMQRLILDHYSKDFELLFGMFLKRDQKMRLRFRLIKELDFVLAAINFQQESVALHKAFFGLMRNGECHYMQFLVQLFSVGKWLPAILKRMADYFPNLKAMIAAFSKSKNDKLQIEDLNAIIKNLGLSYNFEELKILVLKFSGGSLSLNEQQLRKMFSATDQEEEPGSSPAKKQQSLEKSKVGKGISENLDILSEAVKAKEKVSLFAFFNRLDPKNRFVVGREVDEQIMKMMEGRRHSSDVQQFLEDVWLIGGTGRNRDQLKYNRVLKQSYGVVLLFKEIVLAISAKENRAFTSLFQKYQKRGEAEWSVDQFERMNEELGLQFSSREMREVFNSIDKSRDSKVSKKEMVLFFGIPQYDFQIIIELISAKLGDRTEEEKFALFSRHDKNSDLSFDSPQEMQPVFKDLAIEIKPTELKKLFQELQYKGKVNFLTFVRNFVGPESLFKFAIKFLCANSKSGLRDIFSQYQTASGKWKQKSLKDTCKYLDFPFTEDQLRKIWAFIDDKDDGVITLQHLEDRLNIARSADIGDSSRRSHEYNPTETVESRWVEGQQSLRPSKLRTNTVVRSDALQKIGRYAQSHDLLSFFFQEDPQRKMLIPKANFMRSIKNAKLDIRESELERVFNEFQFNRKFNYVGLLMAVAKNNRLRLVYVQKLLKECMRVQDISLSELMQSLDSHEWTFREFKQFFLRLDINLSQEVMTEIWAEVDANDNGKLSAKEMADVFHIQLTKEEKERHGQSTVPKPRERQTKKEDPKGLFSRADIREVKSVVGDSLPLSNVKFKEPQKPRERERERERQRENVTSIKEIAEQQSIKLQNEVRAQGFKFPKYDQKGKGYLTQKQFQKCLDQGYSIESNQRRGLVNLYVRSGRVSLQNLKDKFVKSSYNTTGTIAEAEKPVMSVSTFKRRKPNAFACQQLKNALIKQQNKRKLNLQQFFFQDKSQLISKQQFCKKGQQLYRTDSLAFENLYDFLDTGGTGLTLLNFRTAFFQADEKKSKELMFPEEMEAELLELFKLCDKDSSNSIDQNELPDLLQKLGLNITEKESADYFKEIDADGSGQISFAEFKMFVEARVFKKLNCLEESFDQLRKELHRADLQGRGRLNFEQLFTALKKLSHHVKEGELIALFSHLDAQKVNLVAINDLLKAVGNPDGLPNSAKLAVYRIKLGKAMVLKEIKSLFSNVPHCYLQSESHLLLKQGRFLPSSFLRPALDETGIGYAGMAFEVPLGSPSQGFILSRNQIPGTGLMVKVSLKSSQGVPLPTEKILPRSAILERKVATYVFDRERSQPMSNIQFFRAGWDENIEDEWVMLEGSKFGEQPSFFLRFDEYREKYAFKCLVFEFVITVLHNNKLLHVNCGVSFVDLKELRECTQEAERTLIIEGGLPGKNKIIKSDDSSAKRSGFKSLFRGKEISPQTVIALTPLKDLSALEYLPYLQPFALLNSGLLPLVRHFNEYFAFLTFTRNLDTLTHYDKRVLSLYAAIDSPQLCPVLIQIWNKVAQPNIVSANDSHSFMAATLNELFYTLSNAQFGFLESFTFHNSLSNKTLAQSRAKLISELKQNLRRVYSKSEVQKKAQTYNRIFQFVEIPQQSLAAAMSY